MIVKTPAFWNHTFNEGYISAGKERPEGKFRSRSSSFLRLVDCGGCISQSIFYGLPVFYPAFVASLGFDRAQITQGFVYGFLSVGLPVGFLTGWLIDRI